MASKSIVAQGLFHKLGSNQIFASSWKFRKWVVWSDATLCYYEIEKVSTLQGSNLGIFKGKVDVSDVEVSDGSDSNIVKAIKLPKGTEVALVLITSQPERRVLELVFENSVDASNLLFALGSLAPNENVLAFSSSKGWISNIQPTPVEPPDLPDSLPVFAPGDEDHLMRADRSDRLSEPTEKLMTSRDSIAPDCLHPTSDPNTESTSVNWTSSLGRVASICWFAFALIVSLFPTPMILFLFSVVTGGFVHLLRWGSTNPSIVPPSRLPIIESKIKNE